MGGGVTGDVGGEGAAGDVDGEGAGGDVTGGGDVVVGVAGGVPAGGAAGTVLAMVVGVLWAVVSSVVPILRVTQAMHRVTVRPVCAVGDVPGTGCGGLEGGLPYVQRAMVALVPQLVGRVLVLLVMPTAGEGVAGDGRLRG